MIDTIWRTVQSGFLSLLALLLLAGCSQGAAPPAMPASQVSTMTPVLVVVTPSPAPTVTPFEEQPGSPSTLLSPKITRTPEPPSVYNGRLVSWEPNCAGTQVKGRVVDARGNPLPAVTVQVLLFGEQHGEFPVTNPQGRYEYNRFHTGDALASVEYEVAIIDPDTGKLLSDVIKATTNEEDCSDRGTGRQVATVHFVRNR